MKHARRNINIVLSFLILSACFLPYTIILENVKEKITVWRMVIDTFTYKEGSFDVRMQGMGYIILWCCIFFSAISLLVNAFKNDEIGYSKYNGRTLLFVILILFWNPVLLGTSSEYANAYPYAGWCMCFVLLVISTLINKSKIKNKNLPLLFVHTLYLLILSLPLASFTFLPDGAEFEVSCNLSLGHLVTYGIANLMFQPITHSGIGIFLFGLLLGGGILTVIILNTVCLRNYVFEDKNKFLCSISVLLGLIIQMAVFVPFLQGITVSVNVFFWIALALGVGLEIAAIIRLIKN